MQKKFLIVVCVCLSFWAIEHLFDNKFNTYATAEINLESHTVNNKFSVLIPPNWNIETQSSTDDFFILTNYETDDRQSISTQSIKTEVIFIEEPLDIILENHFRAIKKSTENIIKQGELTIDGQLAKRIWYQGDGLTLPNTISSYISYSHDQTVVIHSYYDPENPLAVDTIERIHWSFKNIE